MSGHSLLCDLAVLYTLDSHPDLTAAERREVESIVTEYTNGHVTFKAASELYQTKFGNRAPIEKVREILEVGDRPLPPDPRSMAPDDSLRHKTRQWTAPEDLRLLAGVRRFGQEDWNAVARFVGNSRTRSQCSQRWQRGLDPHISRKPWTREEEVALQRLVAQFGEKAWIRVSQELGNRSDVQCRYRYMQIKKGNVLPEEIEDGEPTVAVHAPESSSVVSEDKKLGATHEIRPVERIGLDLGSISASEIFWILHL
jgi:hypothetical protein